MSDTFGRRLGRTLGQLALALLNATLLLAALCLFLVWQVADDMDDAVEAVGTVLSDQVAALAPVQGEVAGLRGEVSELRADLADLQASGVDGAEALEARLAEVDARLEAILAPIEARAAALREDPGVLVDRAVAAGVAEAGQWLATLRGCTAPPRPQAPEGQG